MLDWNLTWFEESEYENIQAQKSLHSFFQSHNLNCPFEDVFLFLNSDGSPDWASIKEAYPELR